MFTSIKQKYARFVLIATIVLAASSGPLISIAQAAPVCSPTVTGC